MRQQPFREIARELTRRVREGIYAPDSALPPRLELMREFGVARATLDRAIRELMSDGVLIGRHGSGTYVNGSGVGGAGWRSSAASIRRRIWGRPST